jgi:hypothetical protein
LVCIRHGDGPSPHHTRLSGFAAAGRVVQPEVGEAKASSGRDLIPFSELGAVQNLSRDWVVEKLTVTVGYDTDADKARKIIKKIGQELLVDPELAPITIEPLKMQGIDSMGECRENHSVHVGYSNILAILRVRFTMRALEQRSPRRRI